MDGIFMFSIALLALFFDLHSKRIPNWLIVNGFAIGFCYQLAEKSYAGILDFFIGAGVPLLLLGSLFYFRMLGAGDIKLLAVMGGFLGGINSFYCTLASVFAGGAVAFFLLLRRRNLRERICCFFQYCKKYADTHSWRGYDKENLEGGTFCFSIPIMISVLFYMGGVY